MKSNLIYFKMRCLFLYSLIRYVLKLRNQFINHKILGWILLLIIAISITWSAYNIISWVQYSYSTLSYVVITGNRNYTTNDDVHRIIKNLDTLRMLITQYIDVLQRRIECLPWVRRVSIRIQWPDILKINVIEHIPVAFWNDLQIITVTGDIFNISKKFQGIHNIIVPELYGPQGSAKEILRYYYIFDEILKQSINVQIKSLEMDMRCSWQMMLKNNMYIKLGRKNIIERLNYFIKIYPILLHKINENNNRYIDYIDLRYTAGFVIKWIPESVTSVLYVQ